MRKLGRISKAADSDDESDAEEPQEEQDTTTDPSEPQAGTEKQYRDMDRMAERVQMMIEKQLYLAAWFATGQNQVSLKSQEKIYTYMTLYCSIFK